MDLIQGGDEAFVRIVLCVAREFSGSTPCRRQEANGAKWGLISRVDL